MAKDTKERILTAALEMFSQRGYDGTNIRELAASLGLVKSGIYKHYECKEEIWNALLDRMIAYYEERFGSSEHLPPVPDTSEEFIAMTLRMAELTIRDERIVKTRKLLTLEQFRDDRAGSGDEAFPERSYGDVYPHLRRDDGQGADPAGRSRHAGLCLRYADFGADPPV